MEKIKNVISNIPLFIGLGFLYTAVGVKRVADILFDFSFTVHVALNTEVGQKIKTMKEQVKALAEQYKAMQAAEQGEGRKLVRVFGKQNGTEQQDLPSGVLQIGKKPTTDN